MLSLFAYRIEGLRLSDLKQLVRALREQAA